MTKKALPSSARANLDLADAEVLRIQVELVKLGKEREADIDLQFKPDERKTYAAAERRLKAELAMAEHQKGSAAAWLKVEEVERERDIAQKRASRNGWLAVAAFVLAAAQFIYDVLKAH